MRINVKVRGAVKVTSKLRDITVSMNTKLAPDTIKAVYYKVKPKIPRKTGALANAFTYSTLKMSGVIRQSLPNNPDGRNRPYHLWMAGISASTKNADGKRHVYNNVEHPSYAGQYMRRIPKLLSEQAQREAKKILKSK